MARWKEISYFFETFEREKAVIKALREGYDQEEVAAFLNLSLGSISKIRRVFLAKERLFNRLKKEGLFWSYNKNIKYEDFSEIIFIEHTLKYGDFYDIKELVKLFGKRKVKRVWEKTMKYDTRFIKVNLLIARIFLGLNINAEELKKVKNARFEKIKLLTS